MNIRDIRVGNRVRAEIGEQYNVELNHLVPGEDGKYTHLRSMVGVDLSMKILLDNLGFKEVSCRDGIFTAFMKDGIRIEMSNSGNFYYKNVLKNYVHKIQNLYYELKDSELTFKAD